MPSFRIITDFIHLRRDESKVDQFYGGFERVDDKTTSSRSKGLKQEVNHRIWTVGDLFAYHSGSVKLPPRFRQSSGFDPSQVIHNSQVAIGQILALSHTLSTSSHSSYNAVVRKLSCHHGNGTVGEAVLPKNQGRKRKSTNGPVQTEQVLIETMETEVVDLSLQVLEHIQVKVQPFRTNEESSEPKSPGLGLHPSPVDKNRWIWTFRQVYGPLSENGSLVQVVYDSNDWKQLNATGISTTAQIPKPLERGWKCLSDVDLVQAMITKWPIWTDQVRQVVQALSAELPQPADPPRSQNKRARMKSSAEPASMRSRRHDHQNDESSTTSSSIDSDAAQAPAHEDVIGSTPVAHSPTAHYLRTSKKIKLSHPLRFYTEFQVSTDLSRWAVRSQKSRKEVVWNISIGDVLVIASDTAAAANWNQTSLHPFRVPWSVGQVVSLYRPEPSYKDSHDDAPSDAPWMMEIRWFYRLHELQTLEVELPRHLNQGTIVESDEHVTRVPVHKALGRASITSTPTKGRRRSQYQFDTDGVFTVSFVCRDLFMLQFDEKKLRPIADWDDYGSKLSGPLCRGLLCEKGWPGRRDAKRLQKVYKQYIVKKYRLPDKVVDCGLSEDANNTMPFVPSDETVVSAGSGVSSSWPQCIPFSEVGLDPGRSQVLGTMNGLELFQSVLVHPRYNRIQRNMTDRPLSMNSWTLSPGDCVCLASVFTQETSTASKGHNAWSPFPGPWHIVQVLSIYRKISASSESTEVLLEVRRFARISDLPPRLRSWLPTLHADELLETDTVEIDIPISHVLGSCTVGGANNVLPANSSAAKGMLVQRRVRYLYLSALQRILPVFSKTPESWSKAMLQRGITRSILLQRDLTLAKRIESHLSTNSGASPLEGLLASLITDQATPQSLWKGLWRSVPVSPMWSCFHDADMAISPGDRTGLQWVVQIGDIIAARFKCDEDSESRWFPFTVSWRPCQILAIVSSSCGPPNQAQVRWLAHAFPTEGSPDIGVLFDGDEAGVADLSLIDLSDCLGPVTLTIDTRGPVSPNASLPFLPLTMMKYDTKETESSCHELLATIVKRGICMSSIYSEAEKVKVLRILGDEALAIQSSQPSEDNVPPSNSASVNRTGESQPSNAQPEWKSCKIASLESPLAVDSESGMKFYSSLTLERVGNAEDDRAVRNWQRLPNTWTVKLGDTVAVHVPQRVGGSKKTRKAETLPFLVPWQVAEIVTIFHKVIPNGLDDGVQLEVRWFYHGRDMALKRSGKGTTSKSEIEDEVVETDDLEVVCPSKLIAHVSLQDPRKESRCDFGRFEVEKSLRFTCGQFWSRHRNSLVPTWSLDNRINRGRAHSYYFGKYQVLQVACRRLVHSKEPGTSSISHESPTRAFQRVIEKLSLTDASKEALHQTSGIIGRETERRFIANFLRAALDGKEDDGKLNATLFVAGPPGVGKTACVRATLNELQREREAAKSPRFDFFVLNGMELRHPLDAYSKFWEDVSPDRERCPSDRAAAMLANYFTSNDSIGCPAKGRIVVLLVDELDYLVTKKQNILYDFFNWPTEARGDRRLIVIGVSNTVNLPERLHPRVQSRIGSKRCYFKSYSAKELAAILEGKARAASPCYQVFDEDAITFASKKIAALSGDIRKAFKICRSAAENVLAQQPDAAVPPKPPRVYIKDVVKVCRDSFHSTQANGLALCGPYEALFLVALTSLSKWTGRERGGFDMEEVVVKMEAMSNSLGDRRYQPAPTLSEALVMASRLSEARLVSLRSPRDASLSHQYTSLSESGGPWPLVTLAIDDSAVLVALKDTDDKELVNKFLRSGGAAMATMKAS